MSDGYHEWNEGQAPPILRAHSEAKHRVVRAYAERFLRTVTQQPRMDRLRLTVVDGFAAGNEYRSSASGLLLPGSPGLLLQAVADVQAELNQTRKKPLLVDAQYIFVEQRPGNFEYLRRTLLDSPFRRDLGTRIHLRQGSFASYFPEVLESARNWGGRAIFLLDQSGYSEIPMSMLQRIFAQLRKPEVILTFAIDYLLNYLTNKTNVSRDIFQALGIEYPEELIGLAGMRPRNWRRLLQNFFHRQFTASSGCSFYTPYFLHSAEANRDLWLLHLSVHARARDVMTGVHWDERTSCAQYGDSLVHGFDVDQERALEENAIIPYFFGEDERVATVETLIRDLPGLVVAPVSVNELYAKLANNTPATQAHLVQAVATLVEIEQLESWDKTGQTKRRRGPLHGTDVIRRPARPKLFY